MYNYAQLYETIGGFRETAQCLRIYIALAEAPHLVPSIHVRQITITHNFIFRESDSLFWPLWAATPTYTYIIQDKTF